MVDKEFINEYIDSVQDVLVDAFKTSSILSMKRVATNINDISLLMCSLNNPSLETRELLEEVKTRLNYNIIKERNIRTGVKLTKNYYRIV